MKSDEMVTVKVECKTPGVPTRITRSVRRKAILDTKSHPIQLAYGDSPDNGSGNVDVSDESNDDDNGDGLDNDNGDGNEMEEGKELCSTEELEKLLGEKKSQDGIVPDGVQVGEQVAVAQVKDQVGDQVGNQVGVNQVDAQEALRCPGWYPGCCPG